MSSDNAQVKICTHKLAKLISVVLDSEMKIMKYKWWCAGLLTHSC